MRAQLLLITAAFALAAGTAAVQAQPADGPDGPPRIERALGGPDMDDDDREGPGGRDEDRGERDEDRRSRSDDPHPGEGPPPVRAGGPYHDRDDMHHRMRAMHHMMRSAGVGFHIRTGRNTGLRVRCGKDDIATCVDGAQPLIDALMEAESRRRERRGRNRDRDWDRDDREDRDWNRDRDDYRDRDDRD